MIYTRRTAGRAALVLVLVLTLIASTARVGEAAQTDLWVRGVKAATFGAGASKGAVWMGLRTAAGGLIIGTSAPLAITAAAVGTLGYVGWRVYNGWDEGDIEWVDSEEGTWDAHPEQPTTATHTLHRTFGNWSQESGIAWATREGDETGTVAFRRYEVRYHKGVGHWRVRLTCRQNADLTGSTGHHSLGSFAISAAQWWTSTLTCPSNQPYPELLTVWRNQEAMDDPTFSDVYEFTEGVEAGDAVPDRRIRAEVECVDINLPTNRQTISKYTDAYAVDEPIPSLEGIECPEGYRVGSVEVTREGAPGTAGESMPDEGLWEWEAPPEFDNLTPDSSWTSDGLPPEFTLWAVESDGRLVRCDRTDRCAGWWEQPNRDALYECRWGNEVVDLTECSMYRHTFEPETPGVVTPIDPITGEPPTGTEPTDPPLDDPAAPEGAPETVTEGVFRRALQWAFAPSPSTQAEITALREKIATKAPVSYFTEISAALDGDVGEQCWDVSIDLSGAQAADGGEHAIIDSCGSNPVWQWFQNQRPFLTALVWAFFVTPLAWWAWRQYAPGSQGSA